MSSVMAYDSGICQAFFFLLLLSNLICALLYPVVRHCGKEKMPLVSMIRTACRSLFESLVVTVSDSPEKPLSKSNYQLCTKLLQRSLLLHVIRCNMSVWFYNKVILPLVWEMKRDRAQSVCLM